MNHGSKTIIGTLILSAYNGTWKYFTEYQLYNKNKTMK
jgi:hypothetical protein